MKDMSHNFFVNNSTNINTFYKCKKCSDKFLFKNVFYKHLKSCLTKFFTNVANSLTCKIKNFQFLKIIFSNLLITVAFLINTNIKTWHFLIIKISIDVKATFDALCIDTDCDIFMTNRLFIKERMTSYQIRIRKITLFRIKNIDEIIMSFIECITLNFNFSKTIHESFAIAKISKKMPIVDNFSTKIFIEINVINLEQITINVNVLIINNCKKHQNKFIIFEKTIHQKNDDLRDCYSCVFWH